MQTNNKIALVLFWIGLVEIIAGVIVGLIMGQPKYQLNDKFSFTTAISWWAAGFVSGIILIGMSEIIKILDKINQKIGGSDKLQFDSIETVDMTGEDVSSSSLSTNTEDIKENNIFLDITFGDATYKGILMKTRDSIHLYDAVSGNLLTEFKSENTTKCLMGNEQDNIIVFYKDESGNVNEVKLQTNNVAQVNYLFKIFDN